MRDLIRHGNEISPLIFEQNFALLVPQAKLSSPVAV